MNEDCPDCPEGSPLTTDGLCYWQGCATKATDVVYTNGIVHKRKFIPTGDIELCHGHFIRWRRLGELTLKWDVIDAAFRRQLTTGQV
jgi:hypothetical protein